jgi:hypothetical protein
MSKIRVGGLGRRTWLAGAAVWFAAAMVSARAADSDGGALRDWLTGADDEVYTLVGEVTLGNTPLTTFSKLNGGN